MVIELNSPWVDIKVKEVKFGVVMVVMGKRVSFVEEFKIRIKVVRPEAIAKVKAVN